MDPYLGEIRLVSFNFAPYGWALCNGQLLPVRAYAALFSLLNNTYGGDGKTTFGLPNLQGLIAVGVGQGPGMQGNYVQGATGGTSSVAIVPPTMPAHTHTLPVGVPPTLNAPGPTAFLAGVARGGTDAFQTQPTSGISMKIDSAGIVGGNLPHDNMAPYLALNYIIALTGMFPPHP